MTEPSAPMTNDPTEIMARAAHESAQVNKAYYAKRPELPVAICRQVAQDQVEALASAGYAIVPVEPTETMVKAGALALECEGLEYVMPTDPTAAYKAMIQAAAKE